MSNPAGFSRKAKSTPMLRRASASPALCAPQATSPATASIARTCQATAFQDGRRAGGGGRTGAGMRGATVLANPSARSAAIPTGLPSRH